MCGFCSTHFYSDGVAKISCECNSCTWQARKATWLYLDQETSQGITLVAGQHCPNCAAQLEHGRVGDSRQDLLGELEPLRLLARLIPTLYEWQRLGGRSQDVKDLFTVAEALIGVPVQGVVAATSLLGRLEREWVVQALLQVQRLLMDRATPHSEQEGAVCCPGCGNIDTPGPGGVSSEGAWPYVCEFCNRLFVVTPDGKRV